MDSRMNLTGHQELGQAQRSYLSTHQRSKWKHLTVRLREELKLTQSPSQKSTVYRNRFRKIEMPGEKIRSDIVETLKGKELCLHYGKQVKHIEETSRKFC